MDGRGTLDGSVGAHGWDGDSEFKRDLFVAFGPVLFLPNAFGEECFLDGVAESASAVAKVAFLRIRFGRNAWVVSAHSKVHN